MHYNFLSYSLVYPPLNNLVLYMEIQIYTPNKLEKLFLFIFF